MSEEQRESATQTSEVAPDGAETTDTAPEPADGQLGDAGKRALAALRAENKALKAQIKATESTDEQRDADSAEDSTSDDARDAVTVEPTPQKSRWGSSGSYNPDSMTFSPTGVGTRAVRFEQQLTREDLSGMSPAAITKALKSGQLRNLLSGK
ncbi:hypothetical protein OG911_25310 [Streptomyces sp. NBC_00208]|uniref:hypothetical protein n=1 Tax=Streptomyces sp. NBC_00208 TaxID=2975681 RepID=UPI002E2BA004|nr:hypothetical protein [Streptomyces sp. NBC_00208]